MVEEAAHALRDHMVAHLEQAKALTGRTLPGPIPRSKDQDPDPDTGIET